MSVDNPVSPQDQPESPLLDSRAAKRKVYTAIAATSATALVVGQAHMGFLLVVIVPMVAIWASYGLILLITKPYIRKAELIAMALWVSVIGALLVLHYTRHLLARNDADRLALAVRQHVADTGRCPQKLDEFENYRPPIPSGLRADIVYDCRGNRPRLAYWVTFTVLDRYEFDFATGAWSYSSWAARGNPVAQ